MTASARPLDKLTGKMWDRLGLLAMSLVVWIAQAHASPQPCSGGAMGFVNIRVQAGYSTIGNNYCKGSHTLAEVLGDPVDETTIYKWDSASQTYRDPYTYFAGFGWFSSNPDDPAPNGPTLAPGEGAFIHSPTDQIISFSGSIEPLHPRPRLPGGTYLVGGRSPAPAGFEDLLGFPPEPGDQMHNYDSTTPEFPDQPSSTHTYGDQGWDSVPTVEIGKAAFVDLVHIPPPVIATQAQGQSVFLGGTAAFSITATGAPPVFLQWRRNGIVMVGETNSTLTLTQVQLSDEAEYTCLVSNRAGSMTSAVAQLRLFRDFGDAPAPYPVRQADNGARHVIRPGFHLGAAIDSENDGQPDSDALGDNLSDTDDEDGVTFMTPLFRGSNAVVQVEASMSGILNAWVDFDRNGKWGDAGEKIFDAVTLPAGTTTMAFPVPSAASLGTTAARFRFTSFNTLDFSGDAADGEVEDYIVSIERAGPPQIESEPTTKIVCPNTNVVFSVSASGSPPLFYQWRKNGANIAGANRSALIISNAQLADGGSYSVVVANVLGVATSSNALLCLCTNSVPLLPAADDFAKIFTASLPPAFSGAVQSDNVLATKESGEPNHAGEAGGKSVWYTWRAPASGIATFSTRGSTFDTLLAVYNGTELTNLVSVAQNDDKRPIAGTLATGWFFTSQTRFNVSAGTNYHIAIAGYSCYDGKVVLSWDLERTRDVLPVITSQPASATVARGDTNRFVVMAAGASFFFQWFRHGAAIAGATSSTLTITNVQPEDVGDYTVDVVGPQNRRVESDVATLEIGSFPSMRSRDKIILQLCMTNHQPPRFNALAVQPLGTFSSTPPLLVGAGGFQIINNTNSTVQQLEPHHCDSVGNASRWLTVTNRDVGILVVHTGGSAIPTVLAAYTNRPGDFFPDIGADLDCARGNLSDGEGSYIRFHARRDGSEDGKHWVVVDGAVNFSASNPFREGIIHLSYALCPIGRIFPTNQSLTVTQGNHVVFCAGIPPSQIGQRTFQWFHDGVPIPGAVKDVWILSNLALSDAGFYSLRTNGVEVAGPTLQAMPLLNFAIPELTGTGEDLQLLNVSGTARVPAGVAFRVEASTALSDWLAVYTNRGPQLFNFTEPIAPPPSARQYRGVVP